MSGVYECALCGMQPPLVGIHSNSAQTNTYLWQHSNGVPRLEPHAAPADIKFAVNDHPV